MHFNLVRLTSKTSKTEKLRYFTNLKNRLLKFVKIREFLNFFFKFVKCAFSIYGVQSGVSRVPLKSRAYFLNFNIREYIIVLSAALIPTRRYLVKHNLIISKDLGATVLGKIEFLENAAIFCHILIPFEMNKMHKT